MVKAQLSAIGSCRSAVQFWKDFATRNINLGEGITYSGFVLGSKIELLITTHTSNNNNDTMISKS
jgi:hypothetical protein